MRGQSRLLGNHPWSVVTVTYRVVLVDDTFLQSEYEEEGQDRRLRLLTGRGEGLQPSIVS